MINKLLIILIVLNSNFAQDINKPNEDNKNIIIILNNGEIISGNLINKTENEIILKTKFGILTISRDEIDTIDLKSKVVNNKKNNNLIENKFKLNQEARWKTIYSSMTIANSLYGGGIPYVLGIDDARLANGFRLLMFGGSFYTAYNYTKEMDLPLGRWKFQMAGAKLGLLTIYSMIGIVGIETWFDNDKEGKIFLTSLMATVPYSIVKSDKLFKSWKLSNGDAAVISSSLNLGLLNSLGLINLIHNENWDMNENFFRLYSLIAYSGTVAHGYFARSLTAKKSYTQDDAIFLDLSAGIGLINSILFSNLLEIDGYKETVLSLMVGSNSFLFLGNHINEKYDLKRGQSQIIGLGTTATYLAWLGLAYIFDVDYSNNFSRIMDITSISSGWYFTHKQITKNNDELSYLGKKLQNLSIAPTFIINNQFNPGLKFRFLF